MHTMTRRAALGGIAVFPAVSLPARLEAAPAGRLAELIGDWRWKVAECQRLDAELADLYTRTELPPLSVRFGRRRIKDAVTGKISWTRWESAFPEEIRRHFALHQSGSFPAEFAEKAARKEKRVLARLERQWRRRSAAKAAAGITALEDLFDWASLAKWDLVYEIFAYRPASLAEADGKNRFLAELQAAGHEFDAEDLEIIFGVATVA